MMDNDLLSSRLASAVARKLGAPCAITSLTQLTGGTAKRTFAFSARVGSEDLRLILQLGSRPAGVVAHLTPRLSSEQEARLTQAAAAHGVQVPRVRGVLAPDDGLGNGFITDFVDGEVLGRRIVHDSTFAEARKRLPQQCAENLAALHRIPVSEHPYLRLDPPETQIEAYAQQVAHYGVRSPELAYGLAWARAHMPRNRPTTVVHGDFRMGNLMTDASGLRCVLDWEVAQRGDPMQDLAWLSMRTWRFGGSKPMGGIAEREDLFTAYEAAGGGRVDREVVRFWEAWGNIKWSIVAMRKGLGFRDGGVNSIEECAIGRRMEEGLWDFFQLLGEGVA